MSTPAHAPKPAPTIRVRHPGSHATGAPLAIGPYATGGVIHVVSPATAERLLARGFERVTDAQAHDVAAPAHTLIPEE